MPSSLPLAQVESVDAAVAKVADEQGIGEVAEPGRGLDHPPRRIQVAAGHEPLVEMAVHFEYVDEAVASAGRIVLGSRPLLGVSDVELAADRRDAERGITLRDVRIGKRFETALPESDLVELAVDHVDLAVVEIGRVQEVGAAHLAESEALVDRAVACGKAALGGPRRCRSADARVPCGNLPRPRTRR